MKRFKKLVFILTVIILAGCSAQSLEKAAEAGAKVNDKLVEVGVKVNDKLVSGAISGLCYIYSKSSIKKVFNTKEKMKAYDDFCIAGKSDVTDEDDDQPI